MFVDNYLFPPAKTRSSMDDADSISIPLPAAAPLGLRCRQLQGCRRPDDIRHESRSRPPSHLRSRRSPGLRLRGVGRGRDDHARSFRRPTPDHRRRRRASAVRLFPQRLARMQRDHPRPLRRHGLPSRRHGLGVAARAPLRPRDGRRDPPHARSCRPSRAEVCDGARRPAFSAPCWPTPRRCARRRSFRCRAPRSPAISA